MNRASFCQPFLRFSLWLVVAGSLVFCVGCGGENPSGSAGTIEIPEKGASKFPTKDPKASKPQS